MSMGEQSHPLLSGHIWSPIMRSSRGKFFIFIASLGTMCFVLFLLSSTHSNLKHLEAVNEKCQQQRDSLSAQLQEYQDNRNKQVSELKVLKDKELILEKQLTEIKSNYAELESDRRHTEDSLKEQIESLQAQKDGELKKLQAQINELITEKDKLEQSKTSFAWKIEQHEGELNVLQVENQQLKKKIETYETQLKTFKNDDTHVPVNFVSPVVPNEKDVGVSEKIPVKSTSSPKENVLKQPHIESAAENDINVESKLKEFNEVDKPAAVSETIDAKNNSQQIVKNPLPLPILLKNSIGINKANNEHPEDNEVKESFNVLKPPPYNDNLPQFPGQENVNQPAEKGEYINALLPGQMEQPGDFKDHQNDEHAIASNLKKYVIPAPNVNEQGANEVAQVQDMLNKSPGDTNNIGDHLPNMVAADRFQASRNKMNPHNESPLAKGRAELPEDKQFDEDEDDQDGEKDDDELGGGVGQDPREKVFQEQDFDDQEPNDNIPAKEVEGVVVAPK